MAGEMATSGAMMALRLTANYIGSDQVSQQAECIGSRAREARNMALELRQKHQFMIMGGWGTCTALYPRDESMRFRRDPLGGLLSHAEIA